MALTPLKSFKGSKNKHPMTLCRCDCGKERNVRTTKLRLGLVTKCAACARAEGAIRGGEARRLPEDIAMNRNIMGVYSANAKKKSLEFALSEDQFSALIRSACFYCGAPPSPTNGIDRKDNSLGYTPQNSAPCCSICNYAKRDMCAASFLSWVERIHEHQGLLQRN